MSRIILVLCMVIALTASAYAGQLFSCIDRHGNPVVTSIPQDGMENCVLKSTFKDSSTAVTADTGIEGATNADAPTTGDITGPTTGTMAGTDTGLGAPAGTVGTITDTVSAGSTGAAGTGITATGKGIAGKSETKGTAGTTGSGTTRGSSTTGTKKELR